MQLHIKTSFCPILALCIWLILYYYYCYSADKRPSTMKPQIPSGLGRVENFEC